MPLHDLTVCVIDRPNSATREANTACTSEVLQSQPVTRDSTDVTVAAVVSSVPSPSLHNSSAEPVAQDKRCGFQTKRGEIRLGIRKNFLQ